VSFFLFFLVSKQFALVMAGLVGGVGAAWASFFAAGIIGSQLERTGAGSEVLNRWTFEHAPILCWPLVRGAYTLSPEALLRGVSVEAILLFRTSHIVFLATVIGLMLVAR
jgi:hypothetical protein